MEFVMEFVMEFIMANNIRRIILESLIYFSPTCESARENVNENTIFFEFPRKLNDVSNGEY